MIAERLLRQAKWVNWDGPLFVLLALTHGGLLLALPTIAFVALGLWWNANTISHHFIHRPFFRGRAVNAIFSCYLSLLLGSFHGEICPEEFVWLFQDFAVAWPRDLCPRG